MSKRSPFMFSFQSPYGLHDTATTVAQILRAVFSYDDQNHTTKIQLVQPHEQLPILSVGLYIRQGGSDHIQLIAGNRARTFWCADITFQENGKGTYGEVNMDRPKGKVNELYRDFAALNIVVASQLARRASFKILKEDLV